MTVTELRSETYQPPKRTILPAGFRQWAIWIVVVALILGPILPIVYAAFLDRPLYDSGGQLTFENYRDLLGSDSFWSALGNTAYYAVATAIPSVIIGSLLAVLVTRSNMPFRRIIGAALLAGLLFPGLAMTLGWVTVYGPQGFISGWFAQIFGGVPWNLYSIPGMALVTMEKTVPLVYLFCRSNLMQMDSSIEDAALSVGAKPWRVLLTITLPMMRPALLTAVVIVSMISFESLGLPLILGTPADIETLSTLLYNSWITSSTQQGFVSAGATLLLLLVMLLLLLRSHFEGAAGRFVTATGKPRPNRPLNLGAAKWVAVIVTGLYGVFAVVVPAIGLVMTSFTTILSPLISPWEVLTLQHYMDLFSTPTFSRSLTNSLTISIVGALLGTVFITVAALVAHRSNFRLRRTMSPMLLFPRAVPGIVIGIGFFWTFILITPLEPLRTTIWGIMIAFIVRNIAVGYSVIQSSISSISPDLDRAARSVGADWWTSCRTIVIPLLKPALIGCFLIMFVSLLGDYDPAVFLVSSGNEVLGLTMLKQWQAGFIGPVAALGVAQLVITTVVLAVGRLVFKVRPHA